MTDPRTLYRMEHAKREREDDRYARLMAEAQRAFNALEAVGRRTPKGQRSQIKIGKYRTRRSRVR